MLELLNETPFSAGMVPSLTKDGGEKLVVVVRGTFSIPVVGGDVEPADEQTPIALADVHLDEPGISSVSWESDTAPVKVGTEVLLVGSAHAPGRGAESIDVSLRVGTLHKSIRVFGNRHWTRGLTGWSISRPEPFRSMPLVFERAFGGADLTKRDEPSYEERNPVGAGYVAAGSSQRLADLPLPNLENPRALIARWKDRPEPAAFAFVGRGWMPRVRLAGTYNGAWQRDRAPLLPDDFDDAYYNAAPRDQVIRAGLRGGERVAVMNASPEGLMEFALPTRNVGVRSARRYEWREHETRLDTVVILPDTRQCVLLWRAAIDCTRDLHSIDQVLVREAT